MDAPDPKKLNDMDHAEATGPASGHNASKPASDQNDRAGSVDTWFYPKEFDNELQGVTELPAETVRQTRAVSWEYTRSVIPTYTNWPRYLAFCRIIIIGIVAEFHGALVDIAATGTILGYDLDALFDDLFAGTAADRDAMAREFRTFVLTTAEKTSRRQDSELFRRYAEALAESPRHWFRMRDADALVRFSLAAALACNDVVDVCFSEAQFQVLAEIGCTLYDAVAFYKHRAEGETNDTFAYVDPSLREAAFRRAREVLWALDVAWGRDCRRLPVVNFLRPFGGPIHMTMRRYRFVEEGLVIGKPETEEVVAQTRRNIKLWNRVDLKGEIRDDGASYRDAIKQEGRVLFEGLADLLELQDTDRERCRECRYRPSYGAERIGQFGGVELCEGCREGWADYIRSLPRRAAEAFPELRSTQLLAS
jgi:hypothetical protein